MAANEITSAIQTKGSKTILASSIALIPALSMAASGDLPFQGQTGTVDSQNKAQAQGHKIIGGWDVYAGNSYTGSTEQTANLTINADYVLDEIIGGNAVKQIADTGSNDFSLSSVETTVNNTAGAHALIGGSKANNASGNFNIDTTKLVINGGSDLGKADNGIVAGGSYLKATANPSGGMGGTASSRIGKTILEINGGEFSSTVVGGSVAEVYAQGNQTAQLSAHTDNIQNTITAGTFSSTLGGAFFGASAALGTGASTTTGTAETTIKGGANFSAVFNGNIHGASYAAYGGTASTENAIVRLIGNSAEDRLKMQAKSKVIYAGGFNSSVSQTLVLELTNVNMNCDPDAKWGIYGGSKFTQTGSYQEGSSTITVEGSTIYGDVRGGAGVFDGSDIILHAGSTSVTVDNSQISGYDLSGSTWQGRVFGNAIIQKTKNSHVYYDSSSVIIGDNVYGITIDKETGKESHNPGTAVYGGAQLFTAENSSSTTGKTSVTVTGENTQLQEVFGGGIISGTLAKDKLSTLVVGQSEVTIDSGLVSDLVVGGNISNLFGYSVIGTASETGTVEFNRQKYAEGSSHVTINGGDLSSALVVGGSWADWGWYGMNLGSTESTSERISIVVGTSSVDVTGGTIDTVIGGGGAVISMKNEETIYAEDSNSPDSLVYGRTEVNVSGGEIKTVVGGGYAQGQRPEMDPNASVEGSVTVRVSGGTITNVFGGGYVSGYGKADVSGDVAIYLSGGTISNVYAGGYTENDSEYASAQVKGDAAVIFEKNFGFDGTVSGQGVEGVSSLQFGTASSAYTGGFDGTFSGFDVVTIAEGSTLALSSLTNENIGAALKLNGAGILKLDKLNHSSGELKLSSGTLDVSSIALTESGSLVVTGGALSTTTDQIFTQAIVSGSETDAGGLLQNGVTFEQNATLTLKDAQYTLDYAQSAGELLSDIKVVMLGDLVGKESLDGTIALNDLDQVGENVVLDTVTVSGKVGDQDKNIQIDGVKAGDVAYREDSLSVGAVSLGSATTVTVDGGKTLTLTGNGSNVVTADDPGYEIVVKNSSTLALGGMTSKGGNITGSVNLSNDSVVSVTGNELFSIESISGTGSVLVGNESTRGKLTIENLDGMTGVIFVDPAWDLTGSNPVSGASQLTINETDNIDAKVVAGQNSIVSFRASASEAMDAFDSIASVAQLSWKDDVTVAAYIDAPISFGTGGLLIDGSLTSAPSASEVQSGIRVAAHGMLIANQAAAPADGALVTGTINFDQGSYLGIVNAAEGVFQLSTSSNGSTQVVTDNPFITSTVDNGTVTSTVDADNGLAALSSTGLQAMTRRADSVLAATIADRTSFGQQLKSGLNLWVDVAGENYQADNFDKGGEFEADMGYGTFGADVAVGNFTVGGALQYGTGTLRSSVNSIKNSIDNYGVSLYGTYSVTDNFKLGAELAYVWGENDITAAQSALNQSVDTEMYSAGVRAMYEMKAGNFRFVPSIGLRVSQLSTDEMKVGTVKIEDQDQTLVQLPIVMRITAADYSTASGWTLSPSFKIAYVPTFGDKEIEVLNTAEDVIDTSPVQVDFGLLAGKDNMLFNVNMLLGSGEYGTSAIGGKVGFKYVF